MATGIVIGVVAVIAYLMTAGAIFERTPPRQPYCSEDINWCLGPTGGPIPGQDGCRVCRAIYRQTPAYFAFSIAFPITLPLYTLTFSVSRIFKVGMRLSRLRWQAQPSKEMSATLERSE